MSELIIATSRGEYAVDVADGSLAQAFDGASVAVVDEAVADRIPESVPSIRVSGSESTKTLLGCEAILEQLSGLGIRRGDTLVAVGGGSVQDAATFVSSFYLRGIPWVYCPSTAMAMLDSCIGGKSSINVAGIKNLGGNIYPPSRVVVDPVLAETLDDAAIVSGLAEAVKICFARGPESFASFISLAGPAAHYGRQSRDLTLHVLRSKQWFIEVDEFDRKERQLLNFGHTFGHALEAAASFRVPHGVGVAVGVLAALSHPASATTAGTVELAAYCRALLAVVTDRMRGWFGELDWSAFERAVLADKKGTRESIRIIVPGSQGTLHVESLPRTQDSLEQIRTAAQETVDDLVGGAA